LRDIDADPEIWPKSGRFGKMRIRCARPLRKLNADSGVAKELPSFEFSVFRKSLGVAKESRLLNSQFSQEAVELRRNRAH
jgi:hypothetical protein